MSDYDPRLAKADHVEGAFSAELQWRRSQVASMHTPDLGAHGAYWLH